MLQAMTSRHDGSLSTGHATPHGTCSRDRDHGPHGRYELPLRSIREQTPPPYDLIVHRAPQAGSRKVVNITEVYGTRTTRS